MTRLADERLQEHLSVGLAWSAMRCLDAAETRAVVEEVVRLRKVEDCHGELVAELTDAFVMCDCD